MASLNLLAYLFGWLISTLFLLTQNTVQPPQSLVHLGGVDVQRRAAVLAVGDRSLTEEAAFECLLQGLLIIAVDVGQEKCGPFDWTLLSVKLAITEVVAGGAVGLCRVGVGAHRQTG